MLDSLKNLLKNLGKSLSPKKISDEVLRMFSGDSSSMRKDLMPIFGEVGDSIAETIKASEERAGMAITGSQEEFRARTKQQDMMTDMTKRNLAANETTAKSMANTGII